MVNTWAETIDQSTAAQENGEIPGGVWDELKHELNFNELKPKASTDVVFQKLEDRRGIHYILKNTVEKTYLRLNPDQYRIWSLMDGENTVQDLIVENFMATGNFAHNMVGRLVSDLRGLQMLTEPGVRVWAHLNNEVEKRGLVYRLSAPARFMLTQKLAINGLDKVIDFLYRAGGWIFFTKPMQWVYLLLSAAGLIAFSQVIQNPANQFVGDNYIKGIALIWLASILPVVIHELGHALTVKHYGREVPRGGLMLFFGMPAAFVETTDIWMEPRKARLAVTWNGPYTGLIIAGTLSLILHYFPDFSWNSFLFKMIGFAYFTVFMNVNPLLKYDGYYLLSDALEIHSLRERSLAFIRGHFLKRLVDRRKFTRDEWILTIYGLLSLIWTAYALYFMSYFWRTRIREGVEVLFGSGYSLIARLFSLLIIVGIGSFLVLLAFGLVRLVQTLIKRFVRSGGLTRHTRLAFYLGSLALALGLGLPVMVNGWSRIAGVIAGLSSGFLLWNFSEPFRGSIRGYALQVMSIALIVIGLEHSAALVPALSGIKTELAWLGLGLVLVSGGLLIRRSLVSLGIVPLLAGIIVGVAGFFIHRSLGFGPGFLLSLIAGFILALGTWNFFALFGGARAPAVVLFSIGTFLFITPWDLAGVLLISIGAFHWVLARLPDLSEDPANSSTVVTQQAVSLSVATIVRRVIAQVFFETGVNGVNRLGIEFSRAMTENGLNLKIKGNQFFDEEFTNRTVAALSDIYSVAFDELNGILCGEMGEKMGNMAFNYGVDRLPWQNREVMVELIFSRVSWSQSLSRQHEESKAALITFLKRVPLFVTLAEEELVRISTALQAAHFAQDAVVMREGDTGDNFYIIERGHATFWQKDETGTDAKVHEKGPGQFFGEVALISDEPRNATVLAETPLSVLTLSKADFNRLVREHVPLEQDVDPKIYRSWLLRSMPIFDEFESHELEWLALNMERESLAEGHVIFHEGDPGDRFYIIESGEVIVSHAQNGKEVEIARSTTGAYFGEIALLQNIPRTATITTASDAVVWSLTAEDYLDMISSYDGARKYMDKTSSRRLSFMNE